MYLPSYSCKIGRLNTEYNAKKKNVHKNKVVVNANYIFSNVKTAAQQSLK